MRRRTLVAGALLGAAATPGPSVSRHHHARQPGPVLRLVQRSGEQQLDVPGRFGQCTTDYVGDRTADGRAFHVRKNSPGSWEKTEIPVALNSSQRTKLVLDKYDNATHVTGSVPLGGDGNVKAGPPPLVFLEVPA